MELILSLSLLLCGAGLAVWSRHLPRASQLLLPLPAFIAFLLLLSVGHGAAASWTWVPQLDLSIALHTSGTGWFFSLLVTGVGTLILLYTRGYMHGRADTGRLSALLYLFMFAMLGICLSDHLLLLFIFWELTSISSYLLIGFHHEDARSRRNALQALLVTGLGGMALLAGIILMAHAGDSWLLSNLPPLQSHPAYPAILCLVLLGAFTKSAQFPFHFWLPNAMCAPTPVSAYLHSATMVKAGVFLLLVLTPVLGGTAAWQLSLVTAGSVTFLIGGISGFKRTDFKAVLAGTTLAVLGLLVVLIGIGSSKALSAALIYIVAHAFYKASLFMVAGSVDHETETRDLRILTGLRNAMPWTAATAMLAAASKMGLPPTIGFISKEYAYKSTLASSALTTGVLVLGSALMVALAVKVAVLPFTGQPGSTPRSPGEVSWSMRFGALLLAIGGLAFGLFPLLPSILLTPALQELSGKDIAATYHLWTGFNLPLLLSLLTLLLGAVLYVRHRKRKDDWHNPASVADQAYERTLNGILAFGRWMTEHLQSGLLRRYLQTIVGTVILLVALKFSRFGGLPVPNLGSLTLPGVVVSLIMIAATLLSIRARSRLTAIVALGAVGFGVAMVFALYSAPDLAITQILVETLTVVFFAWVVHKLPRFHSYSERNIVRRDIVLSLFAGLMITLLVMKTTAVSAGSQLADTFGDWSMAKAYGANIVNVILVDFRALDTLGEITVLAIAAMGVTAILTGRSDKEVR